MPDVIILDTGPLSNAVVALARPGKTPTLSEQCRQWIQDCEQAGVQLLIPAVCYYETLRELERPLHSAYHRTLGRSGAAVGCCPESQKSNGLR
jgi:predicted nucleic acid-binding protein